MQGGRILLGGGDLRYTYARAPCTDAAHIARRLTSSLRRSFPAVAVELECVWSGMLGVSKDRLPVMGPHPEHASVCCVGAATGLPWALALGNCAAERIVDGRGDLDATLSPHRVFTIGRRAQRVLPLPLGFAISHAITKRR